MIKNIIVYLSLLVSIFIFNIFYYAWFSWFLLIVIIATPFVSLIISLPFMILSSINGFNVFAKNLVFKGEDFFIGITGRKRSIAFCPLMKINIKADNLFTGKKDKLKICYGGTFKKPVFTKYNRLVENCGQLRFRIKSCRVYDIMGLFFIPVKTNSGIITNVVPKPQRINNPMAPDNNAVMGYRVKAGGGFSDYYELREYRQGDSLKNIHWKLSSKYDELVVKEPTEPVYRKIAVQMLFTENNNINDEILAKFVYVCEQILKSCKNCIVLCNKANYISILNCKNDILMYITALYTGNVYNKCNVDINDLVIYNISNDNKEAAL